MTHPSTTMQCEAPACDAIAAATVNPNGSGYAWCGLHSPTMRIVQHGLATVRLAHDLGLPLEQVVAELVLQLECDPL